MTRLIVGLAMVMVFGTTDATADVIVKVTPSATYLRTSPLDTLVLDTIPIDLLAIGFNPGDYVRLERLGAYNPYGQNNAVWEPSDTFEDMIGVFSSSDTLLLGDVIDRVPGAIDAGIDVYTFPTWEDNLPRDIAEDFWISGNTFWPWGYSMNAVNIQIPDTARYLFVSAFDSYYGTDDDPNGDYALKISAVPEPSSIIIWSIMGLVGFALLRRKKRRVEP